MTALFVGLAAVVPPLVAWMLHQLGAPTSEWTGMWAVSGVMAAAIWALPPENWTASIVGVVHAVIGAVLWWRTRRKDGQRAHGWAGYKARSVLAAVVRTWRRVASRRPVLRPLPGGAV
jgi:hypothetical protein